MLRAVHLVVFDVDGTLTDTSELDAECFWTAAREILRLPSDHAQWLAEVKHYTDLGIVSQLARLPSGGLSPPVRSMPSEIAG